MNHASITRCKVRQWLDAAYEAVSAEKKLFDKALPGLLVDCMKAIDFPEVSQEPPEEERQAS